jgi:hypothetical protein
MIFQKDWENNNNRNKKILLRLQKEKEIFTCKLQNFMTMNANLKKMQKILLEGQEKSQFIKIGLDLNNATTPLIDKIQQESLKTLKVENFPFLC